MRQITRYALFVVISTASLVALTVPVSADWAEEALALQEFLDTTNTFNMTTWVGAHNAYANDEWGYFDPNQTLKPKNLLYAGARQMEYDPRKDDSGDLRLCHGDCSFWGGEKTFADGLEQIEKFLQSYPNSVVFLKLEMDDAFSKTADKLESKLGDYIYKPTAGQISTGNACPGRYGLEPEYLTKADILAAGKNVIVFAGNGKLGDCPGSSAFMRWVHVGLEYESSGWQLKFDSPDSPSESGDYYEQGRMTLVHDPNTFNNINGGGADQVFTPSNVDSYMRKGHNVFELYNFNGDDTLLFEDVKAKHMVWSWNTNEPAGNGDCAVVNDTVGSLFNDTACNYNLRFACFNKGAQKWSVTSASGLWESGPETCSSELGASYEFYVPTNPRQMDDLLDTIDDAGISSAVYVNYHDQNVEGVWQANNPARVTVGSTSQVGDTTDGSFVDLRYMIDRGLYTGNFSKVTSVRIRAKDRIKGLELTYSDGTVLYHGGSTGNYSNSLDLSSSTVTEIEVCIDRYSGEDRVFYLEFATDTGSSISKGSRKGTCTTLTLTDPLMGYFGTSGGASFNSIGFYTLSGEVD